MGVDGVTPAWDAKTDYTFNDGKQIKTKSQASVANAA